MTTATGTARAISRRLSGQVDLLSLYAQLSDNGSRADTMMLETTAGASIILDQAAVRIECRDGRVVVDALSAGGQPVLNLIGRTLAEAIEAKTTDQLTLRFNRSTEVDAERRLLAPSPFDVLRTITSIRGETEEEPFTICLVGVMAFDHVGLFEELPAYAEDPVGFTDIIFWLAESCVVGEPGRTPRLICTSFGDGDAEQARRSHFSAVERLSELSNRATHMKPFVSADDGAGAAQVRTDLEDDEFAGVVWQLKEHILAGDVYQIVPSRTFSAPCADALSAFSRVRTLDRGPYRFFVSMPDFTLFGASPETSVRVAGNGEKIVEVKPIAGTRPRGASADDDDRMEADLRLDHKEVAEHMMLVDLARNDVARVSEPGTRGVSALMTLEKYARVMHLVSSVKGKLAQGYDALHALQACLNVGTLSGAPKLKATQLLRRYERTRRGHYGGAIGWLNGEGQMDTGVVIRSALVKDGTAYVRAGAGVVYDSDPESEADETRRKASAVLSAIAGETVR